MTLRKVDWAVVLAVSIPLTLAGPAVAKPKLKPPGPKAPAVLTGSITGSNTWSHSTASGSERWTVKGLKLKRGPTEFRKTGWRRAYKVIDGTVTWTHQVTSPCITTSFKETFSLKGVRWDVDSRITYYVTTKGRFKNRWFVNGLIQLPRQRVLGTCADGGATYFASLPALFLGLRVGQRQRAVPGKKVKLTWDSHHTEPDGAGGIMRDDRTNTVTINAG